MTSIVEIAFSNSDMRANSVYAPDQYGNEMPYYEGFTIVKSKHHCTQVKIVRERKWARRKQFQKEERFTTTFENRPCKTALVNGDYILIHPHYYDDVRIWTSIRNLADNGFEKLGAYIEQSIRFAGERTGLARRLLTGDLT